MYKELESKKLNKINIDSLKDYLSNKKAKNITNEKNIYKYIFEENIKNNTVSNTLIVDTENNLIKYCSVITEDTKFNEFEFESYVYRLLSETIQELLTGEMTYKIRNYFKYISEENFEDIFYFTWKNDVIIRSPKLEIGGTYDIAKGIDGIVSRNTQVLIVDMEIKAQSFTAARTLAYSRSKEFIAILSVLIDKPIYEFASRSETTLEFSVDSVQCFVGRTGYYDNELDILVYDNSIGIVPIYENKLIIDKSKWMVFSDMEGNFNKSYVEYDDYKVLEDVFSKIEFNKKNINKKKKKNLNKHLENSMFQNSNLKIKNEYISIFKKLKSYEIDNKEDYMKFVNSCKLYNFSLKPENEATISTAYKVAAIEALSKIDNKYTKNKDTEIQRFLMFSKEYLDEEIDEKILKYLYGTVRSGHFHSGEYSFLEDSTNLNLYIENKFFEKFELMLNISDIFRKIFFSWMDKNFIGDKESVLRKLILEKEDNGLTIPQIAKDLGISTSSLLKLQRKK